MAKPVKRPEQIYRIEREAERRRQEFISQFQRLHEKSAAHLAAKRRRKQPFITVLSGDMTDAAHRLIVPEEDRGLPSAEELDATYTLEAELPYRRKVFISYVAATEPWVKNLNTELEKKHITPFVASTSITPGEEWLKKILQELRESSSVVFVATKRTTEESEWCKMEVGAALGLGIPVVSALIGVTNDDLPPILHHLQAIPIQTPDDLKRLTTLRAAWPMTSISRSSSRLRAT